MAESVSASGGPEMVIGLVGAIGTPLDMVCHGIRSALAIVGYSCETIKLSSLLDDLKPGLPQSPEDKRYQAHMDAGNELREKTQRCDALAILACAAIRESRCQRTGDDKNPASRHAYILRSLKTPHEVQTLRRIYGPSLMLIGVFAPRESRINNLARRIANSHHDAQSDLHKSTAESLMHRDQAEAANPYGQNVRDAFPLADLFIDTCQQDQVERAVRRFVELLFCYPFHTPSRHEYAMFHAQAAALRSSALGRQVGAVIATENADIIAVGTNEVPKAGGGLYWPDDQPDQRDFTLGHDTNDRMKRTVLADLFKRLQEGKWLDASRMDVSVDRLVAEAIDGAPSLLRGSQIMAIIEFGRIVHAEMAALMDAARRGASVAGATLYTTTFPCHDCAKHIVAAGIRRVVYVEPYPKSLVPELYPDSICLEANNSEEYVQFEPFVGLAPRRYVDLFPMLQRKISDGTIVEWQGATAVPRLAQDWSYLSRELEEIVRLGDVCNR